MRLAFSLMSWVANYKDVPQTFIAFRRLAQPHAGTSLPAGDEPRTRFICAIGGGEAGGARAILLLRTGLPF